jgi:hypothetical protein
MIMESRAVLASMTALLVSLALLAALTGCESGGDASATASEPLTKAEFIKRASAICGKEDEEKTERLEAAAQSEKGLNASKRELKRLIVVAVIPLYQELISELASLQPPAQDKAKVAKIVSTFKAILREAEAKPGYLVLHDPFTKADLMAQRYGIENCSI